MRIYIIVFYSCIISKFAWLIENKSGEPDYKLYTNIKQDKVYEFSKIIPTYIICNDRIYTLRTSCSSLHKVYLFQDQWGCVMDLAFPTRILLLAVSFCCLAFVDASTQSTKVKQVKRLELSSLRVIKIRVLCCLNCC